MNRDNEQLLSQNPSLYAQVSPLTSPYDANTFQPDPTQRPRSFPRSFLLNSPRNASPDNDVLSVEIPRSPFVAASRPTMRPPPPRRPHFGWWWETGAVLVSMTFLSLIIAIMFSVDGKPLSKWKLPIQPSALVAVFSAVVKSSLLVPIAGCIGQLKWAYFEKPARLSHMEAFDEATRGPWGSLVFIWDTRGKALLATVGATITVLMLAFEPFAQQVIRFSSEVTTLGNETATVLSTTTWPMFGGRNDNLPLINSVEFPLRTGIMASVLDDDSVKQSNTKCPTKECRFEEFESLAVCSTCETEELSSVSLSCSFDVLGVGPNSPPPLNGTAGIKSINDYLAKYGALFSTFPRARIEMYCTDDNHIHSIYFSTLMTYENGTLTAALMAQREDPSAPWWESDQEDAGPGNYQEYKPDAANGFNRVMGFSNPVKTLRAPLYNAEYVTFCHGLTPWDSDNVTFINTAPGPERITNLICFTSTTDFSKYKTLSDKPPAITGLATRCRLDFCAKRYANFRYMNDTVSWDAVELPLEGLSNKSAPQDINRLKEYSYTEPPVELKIANSDSNAMHYVDRTASWNLANVIANSIQSDEFQKAVHHPRAIEVYNGNWTALFSRVADEASLTIQSAANPNVTTITGTVYGADIFVRVRWAWFVLPAALVAATVVFMVLTVLQSAKTPDALFKNSILAVLFHGLEEADVTVAARASTELGGSSKDINVVLGANDEGRLKLLETTGKSEKPMKRRRWRKPLRG